MEKQSDEHTILEIQKAINETHGLLRENTDKLLERHDHLESIEEKTELLASDSALFRKKTKELRFYMCVSKHKCLCTGIIICILVVLMYVIIRKYN